MLLIKVYAFKRRPRNPVVLLTITLIKRRDVGDLFFAGAAGLGVVYYGADHFGSGGELLVVGPVYFGERLVFPAGGLDVAPAEGFGFGAAIGVDNLAGIVFFTGFAGQADTDQTFAGGEDDAAVCVVPGVGFVLAHHRELDTVDGEQFVEG